MTFFLWTKVPGYIFPLEKVPSLKFIILSDFMGLESGKILCWNIFHWKKFLMEIISFGNSFSFLEISTLGNYFCWTKANLKKFLKGKISLGKIS